MRRWAVEDGMPVHRVAGNKRGSVFAYADELDGWLHRDQRQTLPEGQAKAKILVLPLQTQADAVPALVEAIAEEVTRVLSRLTNLAVIAQTTIRSSNVKENTGAAIASDLGVDYRIEGALLRKGERWEASLQLHRGSAAETLWRDSVNASEPGHIPGKIAELCRAAVADHVLHLPAEKPVANLPAAPPTDDYLQGRYLLNRMTPESLRKAVQVFDRVITAAPEFAPAYASKVEALQLLTNFDVVAPAEVMPDAVLALNTAVALDPDSAEVFASLGFLHATYIYDWAAAEAAFKRALSINPNLVQAHQWYAECLANMGRFDDGLAAIDAAKKIDPLNLAVDASRGHVLWLARRYEDLWRTGQRIIDTEPDFPLPHILLFCACFEQGKYAEAIEIADHAKKVVQSPMQFEMFSALGHAMLEGSEQLAQMLAGLKAIAQTQYVPAFSLAILSTYLPDHDAAIGYLHQAADEKAWHVTMAGQAALFDPLRSHPEFKDFLARVGLAQTARPVSSS